LLLYPQSFLGAKAGSKTLCDFPETNLTTCKHVRQHLTYACSVKIYLFASTQDLSLLVRIPLNTFFSVLQHSGIIAQSGKDRK